MNTDNWDLQKLQASIADIETQALVLKDLGAGLPVVEKNARILLSIVRNLKFGIMDPSALIDQ